MSEDRGIIQLLIILVLAIVIISLLGVSLGELFQNKTLKENFSFVFRWVEYLWDNFLSRPFGLLWNFFLNLIWEPLVEVLEGIKKGQNPIQPS